MNLNGTQYKLCRMHIQKHVFSSAKHTEVCPILNIKNTRFINYLFAFLLSESNVNSPPPPTGFFYGLTPYIPSVAGRSDVPLCHERPRTFSSLLQQLQGLELFSELLFTESQALSEHGNPTDLHVFL
jgi:hypothetical protein